MFLIQIFIFTSVIHLSIIPIHVNITSQHKKLSLWRRVGRLWPPILNDLKSGIPIGRLVPRSQKDPRSKVCWIQGLGPWWILDLARPFCRGTLETQDLKIVTCRKTLETQDLRSVICSETLETQDLKIWICGETLETQNLKIVMPNKIKSRL